jgi:hypothetical protein
LAQSGQFSRNRVCPLSGNSGQSGSSSNVSYWGKADIETAAGMLATDGMIAR